jgi:hypothetical protein
MKLDSAKRLVDLYPDRYLNVFHPYVSYELDYNVTRAVISTLRWSRPDVTRAFLAEVANVDVGEGSTFQFDLQASDFEDFDPGACKRKVILGICQSGMIAEGLPELEEKERVQLLAIVRDPTADPVARWQRLRRLLDRPGLTEDELATLAHTCEELERGDLPDGWILTPEGEACVLIEAKLTKLLDRMGLDRHAEVWFGRKPAERDLVVTTWARIASFFAAHRDDEDGVTSFLARQMVDYLDALGLAPFEGFKPYDFDFDAFTQALPKLRLFADAARAEAVAQGVALAGSSRPSTFGARVGFGDPSLVGELRFDLLEGGLTIGWRLGTAEEGRFPGSLAADRVLAATQGGIVNPLAGLDLAGERWFVRVDRLAGDEGDASESKTLDAPFDAATFGEALDALRVQHPESATPRGRRRRGALSVEWRLSTDDAIAARDAVVKEAARAIVDLERVARRVSARAAEA